MKHWHWNNFGMAMGLVAAFLCGALTLLVYGLAGDSIYASLSPTPLHPRAGEHTVSANKDREDIGPIRDGIHLETGLAYTVADERAFQLVRGVCTACHSAQLVTQNRATREGWREMIRWMQATQGLWELGEQEEPILDYLAKYYAPEAVGRRAALETVEWYILEME